MSDQKNRDRDDPLVAVALQVVRELHEIHEQLRTNNNYNAILLRIAEMERKIMEAIDKFAASVNAAFDTLGTATEGLETAVTATNTAVEGVAKDVAFLKDEIKKLQDSPAGPWTPADQATLDGIQARAESISTKVGGISTTMTAVAAAAAALDAATEQPPVPPVPEG